MSSQRIPLALRRRVAKTARYRCGYCLTSQHIVGPLLEIDHLLPEGRGGISEEDNLWLACPLCNGAKSDRVEVVDPTTGQIVPLFNPRIQVWAEHFAWVENGTQIAGLTAQGRATVAALNMNHPDVVASRQLWVEVGWHPPIDS